MKKTAWPRVVYCGPEDSLFKRLLRHSETFVLESKSPNFRGTPQKFARSRKAAALVLRVRNEFELKHQEWLSRNDHSVPIIVLCHDGALQTAIQAMQYGVFDYFSLSQSLEVILSRISDAVAWKSLKTHKRATDHSRQLFVGSHPEILLINEKAHALARDSRPVLVYGELGTGKQHLAHGLHRLSRGRMKFVKYDCRILQQLSRYDGLPVPELAHKRLTELKKESGDFFLFLNHMEHLNPEQVIELLEGSSRISAKIVASFQNVTISNLTADKMSFKFSGVTIPALRKRKQDIPLISEHFIKQIARGRQIRQKAITHEMILLMQEYSWPGNVQELSNSIDRMMLTEPSHILTANSWHVARGSEVNYQIEGVNQFSVLISDVLKNGEIFWGSGSLYEDFMMKMKKMLVDLVLPRVEYNQATAARVLGISRNTLREILKAYDSSV